MSRLFVINPDGKDGTNTDGTNFRHIPCEAP